MADLVKLVHSGGAESRRKAVRPKALLDNCLKVMRMLYGVPCEWGPGRGGGAVRRPSGRGCHVWGGATCGGPVPRSDACPPLPRSVGVHLTPQKTPCLMPSPYPGAWDAASALLPPTSRGPWGGPQGRCNRGTNATLSGTKHPPPPGPWDFPQPWGQPHPKCQAPSTWVRAGGGLGHSPHHGQATAGCGEGETCCPACSRGEGMAWFLSVCNFSSAFIKHQLIL